jgi:hypothetical protein
MNTVARLGFTSKEFFWQYVHRFGNNGESLTIGDSK